MAGRQAERGKTGRWQRAGGSSAGWAAARPARVAVAPAAVGGLLDGDEFVVLLPETDTAGGYVVGEKLRRDIHALTLRAADRNVDRQTVV